MHARTVLLIAWLPLVAHAAETVEFNRDIRPILSDRCFTCHGPDAANRQAKLRLDVESGAKIPLARNRQALVAGKPDESEVFKRLITDSKALRMPPAYAGHDKLKPAEIDLIRRWIEQGAKWQAHWSLIPPEKPALPEIKEQGWARNAIDRFILQRLEREGLRPSPEADRRTLIRRVTLDLTGLPPTPAEVRAFVDDKSPQAYEKVVDRLLASPRHAERMAFRWMEAARYSDTNGYQTDGNREMWRWRDWVIEAFHRNMPYDQFTVEQIAGDLLPGATMEQRMATAFHRNHRTTAEGGIVPEEYRVEYVADRAETTATVWLGLTMGCARCHDHKYDPISQKDFYRMFAFFNNVPEKGLVYNWGNDEPMMKAPTREQQVKWQQLQAKFADAERNWQKRQGDVEREQKKWERKLAEGKIADPAWDLRQGLVFHQGSDGGASLLKAAGCAEGAEEKTCGVPFAESPAGKARRFDGRQYLEGSNDIANFDYLQPFTFAAWVRAESPDGAILSHVEDYWEGSGHGLYLVEGKLRLHVIFRWTDIGLRVESADPLPLKKWQHVLVSYDGSRYAKGVRFYVDGKPVKMNILFDELNWPMSFKVPFRLGAGSGLRFEGEIADARVYDRELSLQEAGAVIVTESISQLASVPEAQRTPAQRDKLRLAFLEQGASRRLQSVRDAMLAARRELGTFEKTIPTLMVMQEGEPRETFVLNRGAYDAPGEKVTAGVPSALPQLPEEATANRLSLAKWLVSRENPLTARVTVNRFWQSYFGTGLVKTVEDFGSQGEWPLHPELLDWLAVEFMDSGWDVRATQRLIVTSATYRQSSRVSPELFQKDPENRLLARGSRLRLGPEVIRDQALASSGLLVEHIGGPSVKPYQPPGLWQELAGGKGYEADTAEGLYRRSLYTFWKRTVAPPFMVNFDSPNREVCVVQENRTNTPLQALNLMNDVAFVEASRKFAERMLQEGGSEAVQRVNYAYRVLLGRESKPAERDVLLNVLREFEERYARDPEAAGKFVAHGESTVDTRWDKKELAAYTVVASLLLNLDETVTKQ